MRTRRRPLAVALATALAVVVLPSTAFGQATRTWVSGVGDDANPCSRTAPCKTFAGAISKTAAAGEINAIDPGGFGAVTITKSITIRARNVEAGVLVSGTNAINISAGATDRVTLSGLDFEGLRTSPNAIRFLSGKVVRVVDSDIRGFTNSGISFTPSTANARMIVQRTDIHNNPGTGIGVQPTAAGGQVTVSHSSIDDNGNGVVVNGASQPAVLNVFRSSISDNAGTGVLALGSLGKIRISNDSITGNGNGLSASGGAQIVSFGNNEVIGNDTDGNPSSTVAPR